MGHSPWKDVKSDGPDGRKGSSALPIVVYGILKRNLADPPKLLFKEVREVILRKCVPAKEKQIRIIFEKQP